MNKIVSVIGLGYIGLPTAAVLANVGYQVAGIDLKTSVVDTVNRGQIHIVEPDLDQIVHRVVQNGKLRAFTTCQPADVYLICVPTPFHHRGAIPLPNIDYVLAAARMIAPFLKTDDLVILESTSPVGTTEEVAGVLSACGVDVDRLHIAYCPERVLPGRIIKELIENDRVVGGVNKVATEVAAKFYNSFVQGAVLMTDARTAEMCKLSENSFRDVNIAFANELSLICANEGIDVWELIRLTNHHPRVKILQPGTGVGGHCIAVDPWFIVARNPEQSRLIRIAREVNDTKTLWVIDKIKAAATDAAMRLNRRPRIACLGLAFKPNIDDLRESPACEVVAALQANGYEILAVEPHIQHHDQFKLVSLEQALIAADIFVVLVRHSAFTEGSVKAKLKSINAIDFVGL